MLEFQPHLVTVLADSAMRLDQLDEQSALEAKEKARQALEANDEGIDIAQAQAQLVEAEARHRAAQKLKGK